MARGKLRRQLFPVTAAGRRRRTADPRTYGSTERETLTCADEGSIVLGMAQIVTVTGTIAPEELGFASISVHVVCGMRAFRRAYEARLPEKPFISPEEPISLENHALRKHCFVLCREVADLAN
jgi:hypothetical protein